MGALGMIVDPETGRVEAIVRETDRGEGFGVRDSFVRGDTLFVLAETELRGYLLEPGR
jgi:hypothetical protein